MNFTKTMLSLLVLSVAFMGIASADWHSLSGEKDTGAQVKVLSSTDQEVQLEITVPGFYVRPIKGKINGYDCATIHMPEASDYMNQAGTPVLPKIAELVQIGNFGTASIEIISKEEEEIDLPARIVPSKGHLTRDINPATVEHVFGPVYDENTYFVNTGEQITIGEEFLLRNTRGVRVQIVPITVNHVTMKLRAITKLVVAIKCDGVGAKNIRRSVRREDTAAFRNLYKNAFVNVRNDNTRAPDENNKKLVVITAAQFDGLLGDWLALKQSKGFTITKKVITNESANQIKNFLQNEYDANQFGFVVIIGDIGQVPTLRGNNESATSDRVYTRLEGNDNYPDAFISRISGNNDTEIKTQLDKIIRYESNYKSGPWSTQGLTIASNEGSPRDWERANWLINGGSKGQKCPVVDKGLKGCGFNKFFNCYDPSTSARAVADAVNAGVSVVTYIGHGSTTSWGTTGFSNNDVKNLRNGENLPVIWSVACVNGKFESRECFAEAWLRQPSGGAIAMEAASTNEAWVPPCDKQAATVNSYITGSQKTFGGMEMAGCLEGLKSWGDSNYSEGNRMAEQCNLFGDCTMEVRYPTKN